MRKQSLNYTCKKVCIGIDVHRRTYSLTAICEGEVVKRWTTLAYPEKVVACIHKYFAGAEVVSAYEAGFSGFILHRHLVAAGIRSLVVHAASIEVAASDKVKTDRRDSLKIATQLAAGRLRGIRIPTVEEERRRLITRTRTQLVQKRTALMNQIRMKLHQFGLIDPERKARMTLREIERYLASDLSAELRLTIETLKALIVAIEERLKPLELEGAKQSKDSHLMTVYRSVPGFGGKNGQEIANEVGDLQQFPNERAAKSFTGLTPQEKSSGEHRHLGHISRQGSSRLRALLVEAAWLAIKKDPALAQVFHRIAARAGRKRAIVAIAARLICKIRACFRDGTLYQVGADPDGALLAA
jgi:transposase